MNKSRAKFIANLHKGQAFYDDRDGLYVYIHTINRDARTALCETSEDRESYSLNHYTFTELANLTEL